MALWGQYLLVADTYSDVMSVIDTTTNTEVRKINLALPIGVLGRERLGLLRNTRFAGLWRSTELDRRGHRE